MRTLLRTLVIAILFVAGCIPTTQQVQTLTNDVDKLMVAVDNYQEKFADEVDRVQERIVVVNEAIKEKADESVIEQLIAGNEASRPFNPYADEVAAALGLVTVIGGIFVKGKMDENKRLGAKYQAHKQGAEKFRIENPDKGTDLYNDIGEARTRNNVT